MGKKLYLDASEVGSGDVDVKLFGFKLLVGCKTWIQLCSDVLFSSLLLFWCVWLDLL